MRPRSFIPLVVVAILFLLLLTGMVRQPKFVPEAPPGTFTIM